MATALSQSGGLLVVREQGSNVPSLAKQGKFAPTEVMLVAQMQGESHDSFASRVLGRCHRELSRGQGLRAVTIAIGSGVSAEVLESRRHLLSGLTAILASQPESEISISAPERLGAAEQLALFELAETALRTAPSLHFRIQFADSARTGAAKVRTSHGAGQPAAA